MDDRFDNTLFSILKETKTIPNFFDVIFGFLFRRTDFYHIATDPNLGVGLPPGVAEKLLFQTYKKYCINNEIIPALNPEKEEELETADSNIIINCETSNYNSQSSNQDKTLASTLDSYNGAVYDNYSWSQTITDLDIQVKIPEYTSSKQLLVAITSSKICVKLKGSETTFVDGDLCRKCKPLDTIWSVDGHILQIHLEKMSECWWNCFLQKEPKLDLSKMDCSRPFHELSDEAQAKIEELTWNQERKRQGLPTSDQIELEKTLKKAWDSDGTPFSGPYDPSKVSFS